MTTTKKQVFDVWINAPQTVIAEVRVNGEATVTLTFARDKDGYLSFLGWEPNHPADGCNYPEIVEAI